MMFQTFAGKFEKSSNMPKNLAKNEERPCSTCLKPISPRHFLNSKPMFWVSDPLLCSRKYHFFGFCLQHQQRQVFYYQICGIFSITY